MSASVCVVIPFYQRESGLLRKSVETIFNQKGIEPPLVIVVDDGSPIPARDEIADAIERWPKNILLLEQKNSGASAARNLGLDSVPASVKFVAFLDSDDVWPEDHLANALVAFDAGADFYFANHKRSDWEQDKFSMIKLRIDDHPLVVPAHGIREYQGERVLSLIRDHMIQTSTVVFKTETVSSLRFPVDLHIFEDEVFWVNSFRMARRIFFSPRIESFMGRGVNISQGGGWGSDKSCSLLLHYAKFWRAMPSLIECDAELEKYRQKMIKSVKRELLAALLYRVKRARVFPLGLLGRLMINVMRKD